LGDACTGVIDGTTDGAKERVRPMSRIAHTMVSARFLRLVVTIPMMLFR
jgi:hypothetical protein